jgi:hypothetical protein
MTTFTTQDRQDAQRTPLTVEAILNEVESIFGDEFYDHTDDPYFVAFARAIERAHGIGE